MILLLREAIARTGGDDLIFFQSAYQFAFGKQVDVTGDILAYRMRNIIPLYVKTYLKHIYDL